MKGAAYLVSTIILLPLHAWSQVPHGTILVLNAEEGEAAVAADSRGFIGDRELDDMCKISALGNKLIVGVTGHSGYFRNGKVTWDALTIAHQIFRRVSLKATTQNLPLEFANAWGLSLKKQLWIELHSRPSGTLGVVKDNAYINGLVVGRREGKEILIYVVIVTYRNLGARHIADYQVTPINPPSTLAMGLVDIANEFKEGETERARKWKEELTHEKMNATEQLRIAIPAIGIVNLTIRYSTPQKIGTSLLNAVGGPIDAIKMDRAGNINWIQRKKNCPAD